MITQQTVTHEVITAKCQGGHYTLLIDYRAHNDRQYLTAAGTWSNNVNNAHVFVNQKIAMARGLRALNA